MAEDREHALGVPLRFPRTIPGFPGVDTGQLVRGSGNVMELWVGESRLAVIVPWDVDPDFGYRFHDEDTVELGDPRDWTVVCVLNLGSGNRRATLNRFSPVVVNEWEGVAAQLINCAQGYSTRDPLAVST